MYKTFKVKIHRFMEGDAELLGELAICPWFIHNFMYKVQSLVDTIDPKWQHIAVLIA